MDKVLLLLNSETELSHFDAVLSRDFDVTLCRDLATAENHLQKNYDILILDLLWPDIDGLTFLKEHRLHCPTIIILLTPLLSSNILNQAAASDVDIIIRKPCSIHQLPKLLAEQLAEKNPSRVTGRGV